jgi:CDP-glucose 4,6-dehydratase
MKSFWKAKNVFVTGATGFFGSYLTRELVNLEAHVTVLVRDTRRKSNLYRGEVYTKINIIEGSLGDLALIERALDEHKIDTVFHLAAQAIAGEAHRNPLSTFHANILGTWNILEACRRNPNVNRIIVTSSDKAYGAHLTLPYDENMPLQGKHPYDVSKSCADLIAQTYYYTYRLPVCIARCGNLFGGGDLNFSRIIPGTIRSIYNHRTPVIRSDGTLLRDYLFVEDAARAYLLLAEKMEALNLAGEAFNFSSESRLTVLDLTKKILKMMNCTLEPVILNEEKKEIKHQYLSIEKARKILGWKPVYSFDEGLENTINWYKGYFAKTENIGVDLNEEKAPY